MSDRQIAQIYKARWGVELFFRTFKQTFGRRKLRSHRAEHAQLEEKIATETKERTEAVEALAQKIEKLKKWIESFAEPRLKRVEALGIAIEAIRNTHESLLCKDGEDIKSLQEKVEKLEKYRRRHFEITHQWRIGEDVANLQSKVEKLDARLARREEKAATNYYNFNRLNDIH